MWYQGFSLTWLSQYFSPCLIPLPSFTAWTQWFSNFSLRKDHLEDWCKMQNPALLPKIDSLGLGWVPGICMFKKHCKNFYCRHPRTTLEKLSSALVFSLGPLEWYMSLFLRIMGFISPSGWFTYVIPWLMPLLTQPDSQNSPPLTLPLAGRMEGTWERAGPRQNLSTGGTSLLDPLELPLNILLNGFGKKSRPFGASSGELSLWSSRELLFRIKSYA